MFTLGRKVDINYSSNRWLIIISIFIAVVMSIFWHNINNGLFIAIGFFLCWALAREIDPKHEKSAFVAGFIFIMTTFCLYDGLQIALILWLLLSIRLISKICGKIPTLLDVITVIGVSGYLTYSLESSIFMALTVIMLILAWFRYDKIKLYIIAAVIALFSTALFSVITPWQLSEISRLIIVENAAFIVLLIIVLIIVLLYFQMCVLAWSKSYNDDLGGSINYKWLQLILVFFGTSLIGILMFVNISCSTLYLLVSAIIGVNLHAVYMLTVRGQNRN